MNLPGKGAESPFHCRASPSDCQQDVHQQEDVSVFPMNELQVHLPPETRSILVEVTDLPESWRSKY